jgi:hypothetical protein
MMIRQSVFTCAAACVAMGCAQIIGIEDLPESMDASSPAADANDAITCMPEGVTHCYGPGYPGFEHEGAYPEDTPCAGEFVTEQRITVDYQGYTIALSYYYHGECGSFARIENAPTSCAAVLERSTDNGVSWAWVGEIVEPGLSYAYTQIGNNLAGRKSRAALACDGKVLQRTGWY